MNKLLIILALFSFATIISCKKEKPIEEVEEPVTPTPTPLPYNAPATLSPFILESLSGALNKDLTYFGNKLYAISSPTIFTRQLVSSSDNGLTWATLQGMSNEAILRKSNNKLYLITKNQGLSSTSGSIWGVESAQNLNFSTTINHEFETSDSLLIVHNRYGTGGIDTVFMSDDEGNSFTPIFVSPQTTIMDISVYENTVWIAKQDSVFRSLDKGNTWSLMPITYNNFYNITAIGNVVSVADGRFTSYNNGNTWEQPSSIDRVALMGKLYNGDILAWGERKGAIRAFRSPNNGTTWYDYGLIHEKGFNVASSSSHTWVEGFTGIARIHDGYPSWKMLTLPTENYIDIEFNKGNIYTVSTNKYYYISHDNGETWDLKQHCENWPYPTSLAVVPTTGELIANYGGGASYPQLDVFDQNLFNKLQTKTYGVSSSYVDELIFNNYVGTAFISNPTDGTQTPSLSDFSLVTWRVKSTFGLQRGKFLDAVKSDLTLSALVDGHFNNIPQIATFLPPINPQDNITWNGSSHQCIAGQAKSFDFINSRYLVLYDNNELFISNNDSLSFKLNIPNSLPSEVGHKIRIDGERKLWVLTNYGIYKSTTPIQVSY